MKKWTVITGNDHVDVEGDPHILAPKNFLTFNGEDGLPLAMFAVWVGYYPRQDQERPGAIRYFTKGVTHGARS